MKTLVFRDDTPLPLRYVWCLLLATEVERREILTSFLLALKDSVPGLYIATPTMRRYHDGEKSRIYSPNHLKHNGSQSLDERPICLRDVLGFLDNGSGTFAFRQHQVTFETPDDFPEM